MTWSRGRRVRAGRHNANFPPGRGWLEHSAGRPTIGSHTSRTSTGVPSANPFGTVSHATKVGPLRCLDGGGLPVVRESRRYLAGRPCDAAWAPLPAPLAAPSDDALVVPACPAAVS